MFDANIASGAAGFMLINVLVLLLMMGLSITLMIYLIKLARRGISALDIYIKKNSMSDNNHL